MRKVIRFADGHGVAEVRGRRAVVRLDGRYLGTATKCAGGRWAVPGSASLFPSPADAADALSDAA